MSSKKNNRKNMNDSGGLDHNFRLKKITPMTDTQRDVFDAYGEGLNLFLYGVAGTGKTYISTYLALKEVLNPNTPFKKVYIVRSSVPSRDMGFMPGKLSEKMMVYEAPYRAMLNDLFGRGDAYEICQAKGICELLSTSFLRGITLDNCIVIFDETQNCSFGELDTLTTRIGNNAKIIFCGDLEQGDLNKSKYDQTGLPHFMDVLENMESVEFLEFQAEDIVRSGFVKAYILSKRAVEHGIPINENPSELAVG